MNVGTSKRTVAKRSYAGGPLRIVRSVAGEPVDVTVQFGAAGMLPELVELFVERWADGAVTTVAMEPDSTGTRFSVALMTESEGVHRFKMRAKFPDEDTWTWDKFPYAYLNVDPQGIGKIRMYTYLPTVSGTIEDWTDDIPRVKALGFNAIHLLPITTMGQSQSPYSAADLFSIDPAYAHVSSSEERMQLFRRYIRTLSDNGMRLCVDLVLNHVAFDNPIVAEHPEWFAEDDEEEDGIKRAGWSDGTKWHKWRDLALLNYAPFRDGERASLWEYMHRYAMLWAGFAAETDGIVRLDNLHSSSKPFMRDLLQDFRRRHPCLMVLGELFSSEEEIIRDSYQYGLNLLLGTPWEHKFVPQLRDYIEYVHRKGSQLRYFFPITSQDSGSPAEEFGTHLSTIPRFLVSALMAPGATGMAQGVEYGIPKRLQFIGRPQKRDVKVVQDYGDMISLINRIHEADPVFHVSGNLRFIDDEHDAILGAVRSDPATGNDIYLLLANLDTDRKHGLTLDTTDLKTRSPFKMRDVLDDSDIQANGKLMEVELPPAGIRIIKLG